MDKPRDAENKFKFTVIYGTKACRYADENGLDATINALDNDMIEEGSYSTYYLDTKDDIEEVKRVLDDAWGWNMSYWEDDR